MGIQGEVKIPKPLVPDVVLSWRRFGQTESNVVPHVTRVSWTRTEVRIEFAFCEKALELVHTISQSTLSSFFLQIAEKHFVDFGQCDVLGGCGTAWVADKGSQEDSVDLAVVLRPKFAASYTDVDPDMQAIQEAPRGLSVGDVPDSGETYPLNGGVPEHGQQAS